jgi:RNA polymerase sigma-70 factor (ECF subfamily)
LNDTGEIIRLCKKGKREAQAALYAMLAPQLLGIAIRYMQDRDEAEDVLQDSFIKIFSSISTFKGEGSFEGWAKRIAVNTALDALKKKNRIRFERNLSIVENIEFAGEEVRQISMEEILSCMETLPSGYRTIVNLFLVEEYSHKEIADRLGIQESTSRSQYARARQVLLKNLKEKLAQVSAKNA